MLERGARIGVRIRLGRIAGRTEPRLGVGDRLLRGDGLARREPRSRGSGACRDQLVACGGEVAHGCGPSISSAWIATITGGRKSR